MEEATNENEAKQVVTRIGKQLAAYNICPNKDTLVKLLKEATSAFPELKQSESLKPTIKPLSDSLVRHGLLLHKDKDIRLLVGICFCEIIRILAPNPDFSDAVFRDIFRLLVSTFGELENTKSPYFSRWAKLLDTVAQLQFCVIMLDIGCEDLVIKMFKRFFSVVRDDHPRSLITSMSSIITRILEEKVEEADTDPLILEGSASLPLLDVILHNLIKERKGVSSASFQLAVSVVQNCGEKLERYICKFLRSCILNRDAVGSALKEFYHEIIHEIFRYAPQMLFSVVPSLTHELLTDQVDVRIKALNLIRKLLELPGQHFAQEYRHVFVELLNRFSDKSAEVRLSALSCAKALYMTNPSGRESVEVLSAIEGRLLDFDDRVRMEAVSVLCDLVKSYLNVVPSESISRAAERLRDKKISVRRKALQKLLELYRDYCTRCATGIASLNDHIEQIPCKILMLSYDKDCQEFRPQSMELVLVDLFPSSLQIEERTRHWISIFSLFKSPHLMALKIVLSQKRRLRDEMQVFLTLRKQKEENCPAEAERIIEASFLKMSASFPDPLKAKDCFHKLNELKDCRIFSMLQEFLEKETTTDVQTTMDEYCRKIGDQNLSEFLQLLVMKCSFNVFSFDHVRCILDCLSSDRFENKHLKNYSVQLLLTIISAFPSLLRGSEKQFQLLLIEEIIPFNEQLIEMLAREGSQISINLSDMYSSFEKVCLEGTRAESKLTVSAIAALIGTSEQLIISKLCKRLVDSLCSGQNIPTVLQSIGCMAQHSVLTYDAQEKEITKYIVEEIFQGKDNLVPEYCDLFDETSKCCSICKLKVFGLKTLVRSFLPHKHTRISRPINYLLEIILEMLQKGRFSDVTVPCEFDEAQIRLAAAKSVLRLSRKWDLHISPQIFRLTVLMAKDRSPLLRRSFVNKVYKLLKAHAIPSRYACAFSYGALDFLKDLRDDSLKYLEEFIREYSKGAQNHETASTQGATDCPAYIIVFLVHVLAHDTSFPDPDCQDEDVYAQFLSPLLVTLQALVNDDLVDGDMNVIHTATSYVRGILRAIKMAEDAVDTQVTPKLRLLAEAGLSILNSLNCSRGDVSHIPGLILLPSSLYRSSPGGKRKDYFYSFPGYKLDESFMKNLVHSLKTGAASDGSRRDRQLHQVPSMQNGIKYSKSKLASCKTVNLSIDRNKEQGEKSNTGQKVQNGTSSQEVNTGGKEDHVVSSFHGSVGLHKEFSMDDEHDVESNENGEVIIGNQQIALSCDSGTNPLLAQKVVSLSSSREKETITGCSIASANTSTFSRAAYHIEHCSSKDLVDLQSRHCDHGDDSSLSGQREIDKILGSDTEPDNLSKRDFCIKKVPLAVKMKKGRKSVIDTSASEVIDTNDAIARTRRRKV
ncbi:sister chromatid cohesion PDS5 homolog A isoform X2 [Olea europaea subsp. europaea]|uniref:Sister chromatid cohesion PDS5 homolog A isoform X2 n=1 Tax=Olea europaea subsp. europaea TaxID=158383 RepID=A0A8S0SAP3_OLEEU|nr:sister chromatid cohesion PDS5 homolog A isoform X2 [Olea europaea subsp. europaea]